MVENVSYGTTIKVVETANDDFDTAVAVNGNKVEGATVDSGNILVTDDTVVDGIITVNFTNTRKTGSLKVTKTTVPANIADEKEYKFTVKYGEQYLQNDVVPYTFGAEKHEFAVKPGEAGTTFENLPIGEYTVEEVLGTNEDETAYVKIDSYHFNKDTSTVSGVGEIKKGETATVGMINNYTKLVPVTVTKVLVDNEGTKENFTFTATLMSGTDETAKDITEEYLGEKSDGKTGKTYTIEVKAGMTAEENRGNVIPAADTIKVPVGSVLTVTETAKETYKTEVSVAEAVPAESLTGILTVIDSETKNSIIFTNTQKTKKVSILKVDESRNALPGAFFALYNAEDTTENADSVKEPKQVGENGILDLGDLPVGEYRLVETQAPAGYIPITSAITITVSPDNVTANQGDIPLTVTHDGDTYQISVSNKAGVQLPSTGGPGTVLYTVAGLSLMIAAAWLLLRRRKQTM